MAFQMTLPVRPAASSGAPQLLKWTLWAKHESTTDAARHIAQEVRRSPGEHTVTLLGEPGQYDLAWKKEIQGKLDRELRGEERKAKVVLPGEEGAVEEEE